jgi:hypothetical protein
LKRASAERRQPKEKSATRAVFREAAVAGDSAARRVARLSQATRCSTGGGDALRYRETGACTAFTDVVMPA